MAGLPIKVHISESDAAQVRMQSEAVAAKKRARQGLANDEAWTGDGFVRESESMVAN